MNTERIRGDIASAHLTVIMLEALSRQMLTIKTEDEAYEVLMLAYQRGMDVAVNQSKEVIREIILEGDK